MVDARSIKVVALAASIFAFTSTAYAYPPEAFIAKEDFQNTFKKSGFQGLTKHIIDCYDKALEPLADLQRSPDAIRPFIQGSSALKVCYLEDFTAYQLDMNIRSDNFKRPGKDTLPPSNAFYNKKQVETRLSLYSAAIFSSHEEEKNFIDGTFNVIADGLF